VEQLTARQEQDEARRERLAEVGTEPPCPFCKRPRVKRSDYTRCNPCGLNWIQGEDLTKDPRASRTRITVPLPTGKSGGVQTAASTTE
jgi:ribosomal protein L37AE/L43A